MCCCNNKQEVSQGNITIVGLGPGSFKLLTMETWELLNSGRPLLLRTAQHPTVAEISSRGVEFATYDHIYQIGNSFEEIYEAIAADLIARAAGGEQIVYAVPGSPLVAEQTVTLIREQAVARNIDVKIIPAMSFLETLYSRLAIDPVSGITIIDSADIGRLPRDLGTALIITQVYSRQIASETKIALMELFPDDYQVTFVRNLSLPDEEVRVIPLYELDRQPVIDHLVSVFVPPQVAAQQSFTLDPLVDVMARLRSPGGCLWDIEQTHTTLRRYIVEEVYEVLEAIDNCDGTALCEELGDLLLQIVFHARIAEQCGEFTMQDVVNEVTAKMVRRHPHVFGDISVRNAAEVVVNWESIKKREKSHERHSVLDGVPRGLPSLMRAYKLQAKAAKVGFDWDNIGPVWEKIQEESSELRQAALSGDAAAIAGELGDLLFAVVNLARFLHVEPETALNLTNNKFLNRFRFVEAQVGSRGGNWQEFSLEQLDEFWNEAKIKERKQ